MWSFPVFPDFEKTGQGVTFEGLSVCIQKIRDPAYHPARAHCIADVTQPPTLSHAKIPVRSKSIPATPPANAIGPTFVGHILLKYFT